MMPPCGGFVHIRPKAFDARGDKILKPSTPPPPCLGPRKIRKMAPAGPDLAGIRLAIRIFDKNILILSVLIGRKPILNFYTRVQDRHHMKAHLFQVSSKVHRGRESLVVPGKYPKARHVMDIQINSVCRDVPIPKSPRNGHDLTVRVIAEPALLIAQTP